MSIFIQVKKSDVQFLGGLYVNDSHRDGIMLSETHTFGADVCKQTLESGLEYRDHIVQTPETLKTTINVSNVREDGSFFYPLVSIFSTLKKLCNTRTIVRVFTQLEIYDNMVISDVSVPVTGPYKYGSTIDISFDKLDIVDESNRVFVTTQTMNQDPDFFASELNSEVLTGVQSVENESSDIVDVGILNQKDYRSYSDEVTQDLRYYNESDGTFEMASVVDSDVSIVSCFQRMLNGVIGTDSSVQSQSSSASESSQFQNNANFLTSEYVSDVAAKANIVTNFSVPAAHCFQFLIGETSVVGNFQWDSLSSSWRMNMAFDGGEDIATGVALTSGHDLFHGLSLDSRFDLDFISCWILCDAIQEPKTNLTLEQSYFAFSMNPANNASHCGIMFCSDEEFSNRYRKNLVGERGLNYDFSELEYEEELV